MGSSDRVQDSWVRLWGRDDGNQEAWSVHCTQAKKVSLQMKVVAGYGMVIGYRYKLGLHRSPLV